jgi:hypothetical protein
MKRDEILHLLREHLTELQSKFGVKSLAFFGSVARDEARADSDVDILVEFAKPIGFFEFMDLKFYLEELLGRQVDLVTSKALKPRMRPQVEKEAVYVP